VSISDPISEERAPGRADDDLAQKIGHSFSRPSLLAEALTHPSALTPPRGKRQRRSLMPRNYERLEFLGDRVLGLVIADLLWRRFERAPEGELTERFHHLAQGSTIARVARTIGLQHCLVLSPADAAAGGANNPSILADACEALVAAIYLDGGLPAAEAFIHRWWGPLVDEVPVPPRDPKTRLQEWAQARGLGLPRYRIVATEGPEHALRFTVAVCVAQSDEASATASSKRAAETEAAAALLALLTHDG
jgi:ribonuclease III